MFDLDAAFNEARAEVREYISNLVRIPARKVVDESPGHDVVGEYGDLDGLLDDFKAIERLAGLPEDKKFQKSVINTVRATASDIYGEGNPPIFMAPDEGSWFNADSFYKGRAHVVKGQWPAMAAISMTGSTWMDVLREDKPLVVSMNRIDVLPPGMVAYKSGVPYEVFSSIENEKGQNYMIREFVTVSEDMVAHPVYVMNISRDTVRTKFSVANSCGHKVKVRNARISVPRIKLELCDERFDNLDTALCVRLAAEAITCWRWLQGGWVLKLEGKSSTCVARVSDRVVKQIARGSEGRSGKRLHWARSHIRAGETSVRTHLRGSGYLGQIDGIKMTVMLFGQSGTAPTKGLSKKISYAPMNLSDAVAKYRYVTNEPWWVKLGRHFGQDVSLDKKLFAQADR